MLVSPVSDLDTSTVTNPPPPWSPCLSLCSKPWLLVAAGDRSAGSPVLLLLGQSSSGWEQPRACSSPALCSSRTPCSSSSHKHRAHCSVCTALLVPPHNLAVSLCLSHSFSSPLSLPWAAGSCALFSAVLLRVCVTFLHGLSHPDQFSHPCPNRVPPRTMSIVLHPGQSSTPGAVVLGEAPIKGTNQN